MSDEQEIKALGDKLSKAMRIPKDWRLLDPMAKVFKEYEDEMKLKYDKIAKE